MQTVARCFRVEGFKARTTGPARTGHNYPRQKYKFTFTLQLPPDFNISLTFEIWNRT